MTWFRQHMSFNGMVINRRMVSGSQRLQNYNGINKKPKNKGLDGTYIGRST
jgi:hypothetical protein